MKVMTMGMVAKQAGVGTETVRFYERRGLIEAPPRTASGYRQYPEGVVLRIRFIQRAKDLGFSLREISELLSLRIEPTTTCSSIKGKALVKLAEIDSKLARLKKIRQAVKRLVEKCEEGAELDECPILKTIEGETT